MDRTKGAQHQDTSGPGCTWYAGQSACYIKCHGRLRASRLTEDVDAGHLPADKGCDSDAVVEQARIRRLQAQIDRVAMQSHRLRASAVGLIAFFNALNDASPEKPAAAQNGKVLDVRVLSDNHANLSGQAARSMQHFFS
ncbi:MAG: transposase [Rhodospirillales bacterium]|nr:transposase [Rhodospirillales bacterium]